MGTRAGNKHRCFLHLHCNALQRQLNRRTHTHTHILRTDRETDRGEELTEDRLATWTVRRRLEQQQLELHQHCNVVAVVVVVVVVVAKSLYSTDCQSKLCTFLIVFGKCSTLCTLLKTSRAVGLWPLLNLPPHVTSSYPYPCVVTSVDWLIPIRHSRFQMLLL